MVSIMIFETDVKEIIKRTYNVKSFRFNRPQSFNYKAGQFMLLTLNIKGGEAKKPFSISSSPTEKELIEFTKKLTGHEFSNALDSLEVGDRVKIDAPYGNFFFEGQYDGIVLLSGGIGITPLRSICRYCSDLRLATKITLIYGNRTEADIAFREELEEMQQKNPNLKVILTLDEPEEKWAGYKGLITVGMISKEVPDYLDRVFYICGSPIMVNAIENLLIKLNVDSTKIKKESLQGY
jgi:ferredoxin-NADP reductase